MARACTVCQSEARDEVDRAIARGEPKRQIATRASIAEASVRRHAMNHLPGAVAASVAVQRAAFGRDLYRETDALLERAKGLLERASDKHAPALMREARGCIDLLDRFQSRALEARIEAEQREFLDAFLTAMRDVTLDYPGLEDRIGRVLRDLSERGAA